MKKKVLFLIIAFFSLHLSLFANKELLISGIYQGENLFVVNPFSPNGVGFCVSEVLVNGQMSTDEIQSSAFEIDLSLYGLEIGSKLDIVIKYKENCSPEILNIEAVSPKTTFEIKSINLDKKGNLTWTTTNENGSLPYIVEQKKWSKWVRVTKIEGEGNKTINRYTCKVSFHSGENIFRVRQTDATRQSRVSQEVKLTALIPAVTFQPGNNGKTKDYITFSAETNYEIFDYYGKLMTRGKDKKVDVRKIPKGKYFINYDNKTETFIKK